jgi:hypothetical protein
MPAAHSDFFLNCCRPKALRYVRGPCAHALSPFYGLRGGATLGARTLFSGCRYAGRACWHGCRVASTAARASECAPPSRSNPQMITP